MGEVRARIVVGARSGIRVLLLAGSGSCWTVVLCDGWPNVIALLQVLEEAGASVRVSVRDGVTV